jgi:hypothetical protein
MFSCLFAESLDAAGDDVKGGHGEGSKGLFITSGVVEKGVDAGAHGLGLQAFTRDVFQQTLVSEESGPD